jgi:ABC-type cobalt transport system, ATPase component
MLKTEKLTYVYSEAKQNALDSVDLTIEKGSFVTVLGANGSGKSTLAKHFNAILLPTSGVVFVEKMDTKDEANIQGIRQRIGMVFQNPDNQIVATIVEEDVAFALENLGVPTEEMRERVDEAMEMAGIAKYGKSSANKLSGGQKQRVAIAGVIAMRPDCLVLDEATAMLDPKGRNQVMRTIKRLNSEFGITVVLITHYMEEAAEAERVIVMSDGKIVMDGTPKQVFMQQEKVKSYRLDVPDAAELCSRLREDGWDIPDDIISMEECAEVIYKQLEELQ